MRCLGIDTSNYTTSAAVFAGEVLDVDGLCGGYNLQWAWSSGHVAGKEAAHAKA